MPPSYYVSGGSIYLHNPPPIPSTVPLSKKQKVEPFFYQLLLSFRFLRLLWTLVIINGVKAEKTTDTSWGPGWDVNGRVPVEKLAFLSSLQFIPIDAFLKERAQMSNRGTLGWNQMSKHVRPSLFGKIKGKGNGH
ncbi:hypothetical protein JTE90_004797 [Oedothorax gibbosus]|uniref:Uncharacterized protein n=1 Tax=Oedothorax gibbosus TaxID=931172 RepID=A0AAV6VI40_9ARAC|nr:hypothetical protein JTE90_004797 [Oedothorax gibbosus]